MAVPESTMIPPFPDSSTSKTEGGTDTGWPPTLNPFSPTVDDVDESRFTKQYENDVALNCEGSDKAPPPRPNNPAAPTNNPSLSCPHPKPTLWIAPEFPNDTVSVTKSPTVYDPSP
ncbi:hypothetical protein Pyn_22759 [Prunus yedoensis var. nudiflora]|uniref:Uncharacterized protein n=1 Tax=Prunus yedoensis var. nudiflora TaxID=2094558 RepID=A0A314XPJ0_PRUYE|nr:hypothetical protein Pyn_22759 [Prunus yedoensis var. nudiflora]